MRAVIQRVTEASVTIGGVVKGAIGPGLAVLLGIETTDSADDMEWLSGKLTNLRIFDDENGVMNRSVRDISGEILLISQFTLLASTKKGNRPSYTRSAGAETARPWYDAFVARVARDLGKPVQTGEFGAQMFVRLINNGPVTIIIDSKTRDWPQPDAGLGSINLFKRFKALPHCWQLLREIGNPFPPTPFQIHRRSSAVSSLIGDQSGCQGDLTMWIEARNVQRIHAKFHPASA
jgi:D-aminoacyl-tRNA deacylase